MLHSKRARLIAEVARSNTKQNETVTVVKTSNNVLIFMDATKLSNVQEWVNDTMTTVSINVENDGDVITSDIELGDSFGEDYDDEDKDKNYEPPLIQSTEFVELHENNQEPPVVHSTEFVELHRNNHEKQKNEGKTYMSGSNLKVVTARKLGVPCNEKCILKCINNINIDERRVIHEKYWEMGDLNRQCEFIMRHICSINPKYRARLDSMRSLNYGYNLEVNNVTIRVCKTMFMATLGIISRAIFTTTKKMNDGILDVDKRGKHGNIGRKVEEATKDTIRTHIKSFPTVPSHYCRANNSRQFIEGKRINFSQRQSYNTRVEAAVVSYNTSGEFLRKLHKNVVNEKSPGDIGKKYLKTKRMKSEKRKCKKLLFSKKVKKFSKQTGPDQHYGLAEPLLDDIPLNELESKKSAFIQSLYLDHDKRIELEIKTREQANSQIWHTERRNRITGSNFGRICKMRPTTLCRSTVYDMLYRSFTSKSTDYGKAMENKAIIVFQNGFNCAVEPCGLIVDDDLHYLAATPDGLVGTDYVVEIKCPLKAKDSSSFIEAVMNKKITFCRIQNENEMELKKEHNYYYQIQGQMHVSKRKFCYFVVYTANWYKVQIIEYDESFWSNKMAVLIIPRGEVSQFYYKRCLASYNFTIYNVKDNEGTCYFWHEGMGNRGSCEIGSCLYQFIKKQENKGKKIVFYCDKCGG
ncbi:hypothetical protein QTP88_011482 [Uroleucon formosanum]